MKPKFASPADYEICRRLHKVHGTTYYFSSRFFPAKMRDRTDALYGFVRTADEWVDNPENHDLAGAAARLDAFEKEYRMGLEGVRPSHPVMRAFVDVVVDANIDRDEPLIFLKSMRLDLDKSRYETFTDLLGYIRGSASAIGIMMCSVVGAEQSDLLHDAAMELGTAMQMTNFLRDVGDDAERGRIYLPLEDLRLHNVAEEDVLQGNCTPEFVSLMKFEVARTRESFARADANIPLLPRRARRVVKLGSQLYAAILDEIEANKYDVFAKRAHTTKVRKLLTAAKVLGFG